MRIKSNEHDETKRHVVRNPNAYDGRRAPNADEEVEEKKARGEDVNSAPGRSRDFDPSKPKAPVIPSVTPSEEA